jgi:predicted AAA+ superfamily ATPase
MYERFVEPRAEEVLSDTLVVLIGGPRRAGKTTLVRKMGDVGRTYITLDDQTVLEQVFLVATLQSWYTNALKRIAKTPKLHFLDSGLLATARGLSFDWVRPSARCSVRSWKASCSPRS